MLGQEWCNIERATKLQLAASVPESILSGAKGVARTFNDVCVRNIISFLFTNYGNEDKRMYYFNVMYKHYIQLDWPCDTGVRVINLPPSRGPISLFFCDFETFRTFPTF